MYKDNKKQLFLLNEMDSDTKKSVDFVSGIPEVEKIVCMPDVSLKEKYKNLGYKIDFPSSCSIVANDNVLYPQLNARGINCGMSLMKIKADDIDIKKLENIILKINRGLIYNVLYKFHLPLFDKYNINRSEMIDISKTGINFLLNKFNLPGNTRNKFENNGSCELSYPVEENEFISKKWLKGPKSLIKKFGRNFYGNHFFEVQKINKIFDYNLAEKYNISKNNIYIMYHTAGWGIEAIATDYFLQKYIKKECMAGITDKKIKQKTMDLYNILMNFSYAYRLATYIILKDEIKKEFNELEVDLITDVPHNTVRLENNNYYYRRNSIELFKNKLSIIAGSNRTDSFLVLPGENYLSSYKSADHGSGEVLARQINKKNIEKSSNQKIKKYKLKKGANSRLTTKSSEINYYDIENEVINLLKKEKIITPVVSLSPIINFKYKY